MADANVSQLEINGTTYDICDATARDSLSQYLPLTGGTLTGSLSAPTLSTEALNAYEPDGTGHVETNKLTLWANSSNDNYAGLYFRSYNGVRNEPFIKCYGSGNSAGDAVVIGNGGLITIGGGESATTAYNYYLNNEIYNPTSETFILTSDNNMLFIANANTFDDRRVLRMTQNGGLYFDAWKVDITKANNDITSRNSHSYCVVDKNGLFLGWLEMHAETDGTVDLVCKARNYGTGTGVSHGFVLGIANNGKRETNFDDPAAWLKGLKSEPKTYNATKSSGITGTCSGWQIGYHGHIDGDLNTGTKTIATRTWTTVANFPVHPISQINIGNGFIWDSGTWKNMETRLETNGDIKVWADGSVGNSAQILFTFDFATSTLYS